MKRLNLGCGKVIKEGWINVDIQKGRGIDKSFDFNKFPYPFENNVFDEVLIDNVLEHLQEPQKVMKEIWRISKKNATIRVIVPYYNTWWAWGDITHVHYFNENSIKQVLGEVDYIHDKQKENFEITKMKAVPQRYLRFMPPQVLNIMKRLFGNIIIQLDVEAKIIKN